MNMELAKQMWNTLNELYDNDREGYEEMMMKHLSRVKDTKPIKPKFCLCAVADFEQVTIETKVNQYKEKLCNYYIYIYHSDETKKPVLPNDVVHNVDALKPSHLFISTNKIKGESSKDIYAEAVIHSILWNHMNHENVKKKVVSIIFELMNSLEKSLRENCSINTNHFEYVHLDFIPKTKHFLNPHCFETDGSEPKEENEVDKTDLKFYKILNEKWKEKKEEEPKKQKNEEIKLFDSSNAILNDLRIVKTEKKKSDMDNNTRRIPKQVKSYNYKIIDRYLHIFLEFTNITYDDLEILKKKNQVDVYVCRTSLDAISLKFKESLSDNARAYYNEKLKKLTISIELLD